MPNEVKDLANWEPKPCGDGHVFGCRAAPEWEVRRRLKLLGNYLADIAVRDAKVTITLHHDWEDGRKFQLILNGRKSLET